MREIQTEKVELVNQFENGLSGIGYAMLYLIENGYLDTDYEEIFGTQHKEILAYYENIATDPSLLLTHNAIIFFLYKAAKRKAEKEIDIIIKKIFEGLELFFTIQFQDFYDFHYVAIKTDVFNIFKIYLKLIDFADYPDFAHSVLDDFASLYRKGKIVSSLGTGYYFNRIASKYKISGYEDIIHANICHGIKNIYPCVLSLKEKIDLLQLIKNNHNAEYKVYDGLLNSISVHSKGIMKNLTQTADKKHGTIGYGGGLSRLLIFVANQGIELL